MKEQSQSPLINEAQRILLQESQALSNLSHSLANTQQESFTEAVKLITNLQGRLILSGIGKSGHIANKISATLASTGTPSFSVHPVELVHGDFGAITPEDAVLAISNSGHSSEILNILPSLKRLAVKILSISSNLDSPLAKHSDISLSIEVKEEACPLKLAPMTSTTATLALGDALAGVLMIQKGFSVEDFLRSHPGGSLGRQLLKVSQVMRSDNLPLVRPEASYVDVLEAIDEGKMGFSCVFVDNDGGQLLAMITDGDLRRAQLKYKQSIYQKSAQDLMNHNPRIIKEDALATEALKLMQSYRISNIPVVSVDGSFVGVVDLKDLLEAGLY